MHILFINEYLFHWNLNSLFDISLLLLLMVFFLWMFLNVPDFEFCDRESPIITFYLVC